ncbi:MAG TPA: shikimate kinase, partial [Oscillospiraceae bacterium]|nr:shikimate kinase [Oscillospiraceae bacterium]
KPAEIIVYKGEAYFRDLEAEVIKKAGKEKGQIIATGGGAILREENRKNLRQNAFIVFIKRELDDLATDNRPLSADREKLESLYVTRLPIYEAMSDTILLSDDRPKVLAERLMDLFYAHRF